MDHIIKINLPCTIIQKSACEFPFFMDMLRSAFICMQQCKPWTFSAWRRGSMGTRRAVREDLGALEHVLHAVRRVDHVVLRQVVPHVPVLVVPSTIKMSPANLRVSSPVLLSECARCLCSVEKGSTTAIRTSCRTMRREPACPCPSAASACP